MPSVDETTPLWEQGVVSNTNHLGEHQQDENDDNDNHTTPLLRHNTVELGPPADPYRISYWIMVIQGASMLLPWNVFITAQGFFKLKFTGSPYEDNFQNYFSIGFMGTNLLVVGSSILIQKQVINRDTKQKEKREGRLPKIAPVQQSQIPTVFTLERQHS
ncbi:hypothetical protein BKA57DRAFT_320556 [Linnemannia elongata]|nr:hypothetical protein BKA57DRAFT_320556 [Linnemannia elongata]